MAKVLFPSKTILEVLSGVWINLTSVYFGALVVSPSIFGTNNINDFWNLILKNPPAAILGLAITVMTVLHTDMSFV